MAETKTEIWKPRELLAELELQKRSLPSEIAKTIDLGQMAGMAEELDPQEIPVTNDAVQLVVSSWRSKLADLAPLMSHGSMVGSLKKCREDFFGRLDASKLEEIKPIYWVNVDVEDGTSTLGLSYKEAQERIKSEKRQPLFIECGVSLKRMRPGIAHTISCTGTAFGPNRTSSISNTPKGPQIGQIERNGGNPTIGTPSCKLRLLPC